MNRRERDILIQQLLDGDIPPAKFEELQDLLLADPEARKRFYGYAKLHQALCFSSASPAHRRGHLGSSLRTVQQRRTIRQTLAVAAAAVLAVAVALQLIHTVPDEPAASLRTSPGSAFVVTHAANPKGNEPAPGTLEAGSSLELERGTAELQLSSGVTAIVQAPAKLVIHGSDRVFLARGKSWFQVGKEGRGFQVVTRELEVTDLGTEFGIVASENEPDEVHCFEGKVIARGLGPRSQSESLGANDAFQTDPVGRLRPVGLRPEDFLRSLPSGPTYLHWRFDDMEDGTFPSKGGHPAASQASSRFAPTEPDRMPTPVPGRFGQALRFDGNDDDLAMDWPGIPGDAPRSVSVWIKVPHDHTSDADIISWGTRLPYHERFNHKFKLGLSRGGGMVPVVSFGGSRYYAKGVNVANGRWHHIACTYRGGPLEVKDAPVKLYVDGSPYELTFEDDTGFPGREGRYPVNTSGRTPLLLGAALSKSGDEPVAGDFRFRGEMDELYIFEYPITAETVESLYKWNRPDAAK